MLWKAFLCEIKGVPSQGAIPSGSPWERSHLVFSRATLPRVSAHMKAQSSPMSGQLGCVPSWSPLCGWGICMAWAMRLLKATWQVRAQVSTGHGASEKQKCKRENSLGIITRSINNEPFKTLLACSGSTSPTQLPASQVQLTGRHLPFITLTSWHMPSSSPHLCGTPPPSDLREWTCDSLGSV